MPVDSQSRRRRTSQACKPCGKRKVKASQIHYTDDLRAALRSTASATGILPGVDDARRTISSAPTVSQSATNGTASYSNQSDQSPSLTSLGRLTPLSSSAPLSALSLEVPHQTALQESRSDRSGGSRATPSAINNAPSPHHTTTVPFHVSRRLFHAYFRCIHPIWPVLYKPLYSALDHDQVLEVLPRPLVYAILSLAVLIHESENDQMSKYDQSQDFFDESMRTLRGPESSQRGGSFVELKPSITNCQVYTILALQQHGIGELAQAGTLCAIASSMAIDQSLHRRSDTDNHVEAQVRARLWWTIYVLEKMLSGEMGRPIVLRAEEAETPFPSVEESDEYEFYTESAAEADTIVNVKRHQSLKLRTISAFHTSIRIAMIMESVSREIYSFAARQRIRNDREAGEQTRLRLWAELQEYENAMERSPLKLDMTGSSASVPVAVTNYVFMWLVTILVHRPFMESWQPNSSSAATSSLHQEPGEVCLFAANKICSIIEMYTRYMCGLPCDLVFPIFVAANILQRHWRRMEGVDAVIGQRLELCVKWLNGLGKSWKNAERRQQMLTESINSTSQDAQTAEAETATIVPLQTNEASNLFNDCSNVTLLSMEDSFDMEYLQWLNSLDLQSSLEKHTAN